VLYSTEKDDWLKDVIVKFDATRPTVNGRPIKLSLKMMGSREMYLAVLDGAEKPDLISPASSLQVSILQDLAKKKFGSSLVNPADKAACRPVLTTPLVLVAWRERATALWGEAPSGNVWKQLHDALVNPKGWEVFGHPEWGYVKFGHTSPLKSNSGFMTILLMTYNYFGKTSDLASADILSDTGYQKWFKEVQSTISEFGDSTGIYMKDMIAYGPSRYDIAAVYESTAIEQMDNALGRYGELRVYYPPATVLSDHPFCVLSAEWVKPEAAQAAEKFVDYLTSQPTQELALMKYGFRPIEPTVALDQSGSPFNRYKNNGLKVSLPPQVQVPAGDVLNTLLDFWSRAAQK
jgi:ABC-type Fe3+ transport system substrate-binding protein